MQIAQIGVLANTNCHRGPVVPTWMHGFSPIWGFPPTSKTEHIDNQSIQIKTLSHQPPVLLKTTLLKRDLHMVGPQTLSSKGLKREKTSFLTAHSSQEWLDCRTYNHKVVGLNPTKLTAGFTMSRNCFSKLRLCDSQCINMVFSRKVNKQS